MSPVTEADGHDNPGLVDELVPSVTAVIDDLLVGAEHPVRQPVVAHELPDVLDRVQLRGARRQGQERDVVGDPQLRRDVPARLVSEQHGMRAGRHGLADLLQLRGHGLGVAIGQDQTRTFALLWADRAKDVGPGGALVVRGCGSRAAPGPAPSDLVLLSDAGFVVPPQLYLGALRKARPDRFHSGWERFLNCSISSSFWA